MSPGLTRHRSASLGPTRYSLTHLRAQAVPSRTEPFQAISSRSPTVCLIVDSVLANHRHSQKPDVSQNGIRPGNIRSISDFTFPFCRSHSSARTEKRNRCRGTPHAHVPTVLAYALAGSCGNGWAVRFLLWQIV